MPRSAHPAQRSVVDLLRPTVIPPFLPAPPTIRYPPWYSYPTATASTNGLAIASLILSIISLLGIGSVIGIIFGFVSRAQIRRSGGAQKGAGLALAGIIIGFVTLSLVLLAVAIPTFLGVRASDSISVVHLAPVPIALGYPEQGGQAAPVVWQARSQPYDTTLTPTPDGVDMRIASPQQSEWAVVPVKDSYQSIQLTASVGITGGTAGNAIGLGCITPSLADQVEFLIHHSGAWQIVATTDRAAAVVDGGTSAVIHDVGDYALTVACQGDLARPGQTLASFEVNGAPVASDIVDVSSSQWMPSIQLCSCGGDDTGRFTDIGYFASYDPPPSS